MEQLGFKPVDRLQQSPVLCGFFEARPSAGGVNGEFWVKK
jgi:hypothetical protein